MTFALPAVAGLKSRLVDESEQGRMQAAISTAAKLRPQQPAALCAPAAA